ncbi:MAG: PIN domain-containing protein [Rhodobacter sp.]|nr:PIN domain-containing protein [Rhodobacter sp.]
MAQRGECEIWTSAFTLAEVYKRKCDGVVVGLEEAYDEKFEDLIESEFVKKVSVDMDVGTVARRLLRKYPRIGKPQDAVHVASCLLENVDEFHTFDRDDLLALDGQRRRQTEVNMTRPSASGRSAENRDGRRRRTL